MTDSMRRIALMVLLAALCGLVARAQQQTLTLDDIYGPGGGSRFSGTRAAALTWLDDPWLDDSHYLWPNDDAGGSTWLKVEALTGKAEPFLDPGTLAAAYSKAPGVTADEARRASQQRPANFNGRHDGFLTTMGDDLFYYDIPKGAATRLTNSGDTKEEATFSPDGRSVAFVSNNNLYVTSVAAPAIRPLTTDGAPEVLNGKLDWVYSEELYGRGNHRAYWWSPDSSRIAFLQLNEQAVPKYPLIDDIPYDPVVESWTYPKAGDPNPLAKLAIVSTIDGATTWVDTNRYTDFLIVNAGWTPDSRAVIYQIQDRQQTWLDLNLADRAAGTAKTLFRESSKAWVERWADESADPVWLKDGSFLWLSERTGWRHLYHYTPDGTLIKQVTDGAWEVRSVQGVDRTGDWIYFSGTERTVLGDDVYRIHLDGAGLQRISSSPGHHYALFNPARSLYLDSWSDATTPPQVRLHRSDGREARVVEPNPVPALNDYKLAKPEFLQVKTRDGFVMEAMMIKPPDFDPSRHYPVYQSTYGGPHAQQVRNSWDWSDYMYNQLLAQHGVIVWMCDNRTASGKGAVSVWPLYRRFGEIELRDIEDCMSWLRQQPYVDSSRIGIAGGSFGGYVSLLALTHPSSFSMAIADCPGTDWRDYDTIYTERYMGLPADNPEGYRKSSPRFNAADLHGQLLLLQGAIDDNVHPQNTMQFAHELQKAGKTFQMMLYPASRHGLTDPQLILHERQLMLEFTLRNLKVEP
jgi:dipeptidyl-peptidase 4